MPDRIPEDMLNRMLEIIFVLKDINIIMGIIWNKII